MGGGINHMLFLMEKIQTGERVVYRYGSDDLGAYGVGTSYDTPNEWIIRDFEGRKIEMLGYGGYHTLFLVSGDVYGIGYDANGEMGIPQRGNFYNMVGFPFTEPVRYLSCGFFYNVFITCSNKLYVCGSNEKSLLGVNDYLKQDETEQIFRIIHVKEFDHVVSEVFTGAMHWFLRTTDGTLYYSGQNYDYRATQDEEQQPEHICKIKSRGHLVVCDRFASKDMKFALGNQITVMYMGAKEEALFSTQFVQSLLNGGEKATTHADVLIFC
jgi:alpha-tubulin suppressor-like RCC1 family protein